MMVEAVYETVGPFVIPVVLFVVGVAAYGLLAAVQRWVSSDDSVTSSERGK